MIIWDTGPLFAAADADDRDHGRCVALMRHTPPPLLMPAPVLTEVGYLLELLRSWAVPRGPSLDPAARRLAVPVEDHSLAAGDFEGVHEGQRRGSGAVIIWDEGTAEILHDQPGHVSFTLHGRKLSGGFALTRTGERRWILVKVRDQHARPGTDIVAESQASVRSGRTWQQVGNERCVGDGP